MTYFRLSLVFLGILISSSSLAQFQSDFPFERMDMVFTKHTQQILEDGEMSEKAEFETQGIWSITATKAIHVYEDLVFELMLFRWLEPRIDDETIFYTAHGLIYEGGSYSQPMKCTLRVVPFESLGGAMLDLMIDLDEEEEHLIFLTFFSRSVVIKK